MATGIGPITPISQFEILRTDPWTNAINAYKGVKEGQGRGLENQKMKEEMPYVGPRQDAALKQAILMNQGLDYKNQQSSAEAPYYGQNAESDAYKKQMEAVMYEEIRRSEIERRKAQSLNEQHRRDNPTIGRGSAGQWDAIRRLEAAGDFEGAAYIRKAEEARIGAYKSLNERIAGDVPGDFRNKEHAIFSQIGYSPLEAEKLRKEGVNIFEAGLRKGIPIEQTARMIGNYPITTAEKSRIQDMAGSESEVQYWTDWTTQAIKPFLGADVAIFGFSGEQIYKTVANEDLGKRAAFYAANQVQMESAAKKLRASGTQSGIRAIESMMKHSNTEVAPHLQRMDPEGWALGQKMAADVIGEGARRYTKAASDVPRWMEEGEKESKHGYAEPGSWVDVRTTSDLKQSIANSPEGAPSVTRESVSAEIAEIDRKIAENEAKLKALGGGL